MSTTPVIDTTSTVLAILGVKGFFFFYNYYLLTLRETRENTTKTPFKKQKKSVFETVVFLFPQRDDDGKLSTQFMPLAAYVMRSRCVLYQDELRLFHGLRHTRFYHHKYLEYSEVVLRFSDWVYFFIAHRIELVYRRIINLHQITIIVIMHIKNKLNTFQ